MKPVADIHASTSSARSVEAIVEDIAREAGKLALTHFRSLENLPVERKGHLDLVTEADKQVEKFLIARLRDCFPDDGIFGEEGGEIPGTSGRIWVVDPIDGTFNFVRGSQNWAISIGLYENRRPAFGVIHAPVRDMTLVGGKTVPARLNGKPIKPLPALDMSRASTGFSFHPSVSTDDRLEVIRFISDDLGISFRFCGAATISLIEVAMGETDGYVSVGDSTWDVMAALPILASLGVSDTIDWDRIELPQKLRFACGSEDFLSKVRPLLQNLSAAA
ncbi:arabinose phosphate phosphatase (plasmid) [Agrobacterium fabrum]|uniref:inositol monophosphatase family protein n=1 Tax=Rhizobium/Agrobacterium group TaxID=227290 RepID=UPI0004D770DB|nr:MULTISPECIES: inositol monophosphatase family protein [Rhizobium/Agrobacterium group]KEA04451.1 arabinose phosphate phosphatase [Rhizobium rhizogenes]NMV72350.1 inositol monophosphatase [Agrobacterium fabrum]NTI85364.1 inositol monophosphatase [Rhizobium rhizogenes]NTJ27547.1 inositol monophosphatase [Rhizobium rhizogenes]QRM41929.1 inositol monophosphatase [Rhizobium rhizogenes]